MRGETERKVKLKNHEKDINRTGEEELRLRGIRRR